jgi:hypothetical protein
LREGVREGGNAASNLTNVQCKTIGNCHNEYFLIKTGKRKEIRPSQRSLGLESISSKEIISPLSSL